MSKERTCESVINYVWGGERKRERKREKERARVCEKERAYKRHRLGERIESEREGEGEQESSRESESEQEREKEKNIRNIPMACRCQKVQTTVYPRVDDPTGSTNSNLLEK